MDKKAKKILALLFAQHKVSKKELEKEGLLDALQKAKELISDTPFVIVASKDFLELALDAESSSYIKSKMQTNKEEEFTDAMLQVLTLILYCGPISKAEIDFVRGVNSANSLRKLFLKGYLNKEKRGLQTYYSPSVELLAFFGITSQDDLEGRQEFCEKIRKFIEPNED